MSRQQAGIFGQLSFLTPLVDPKSGVVTDYWQRKLGRILTIPNLFGIYTPDLTDTLNLDGSTPYMCQYLGIGNIIMVSGRVDVNPTAAAQTQLGISLPFPSIFTATEQCAGTAFAANVAGQGAAVIADIVNNVAQMNWVAVDTSNQGMFFIFSYQILN